MEDFSTYKELTRKLKIITASTPEETTLKAQKFEKDHNVIEVKQSTGNIVFVFYLE